MPEPKTLEEHRKYMEGFARVSFYFARKWLAPRFPERPIGELLRDHTPLLYHGLDYSPAVWQNEPECQEILNRANRLAELPPDEFENTMWDEIKELAAKRADMSYPHAVGVKAPMSWNCGCLKYDTPAEHPQQDPSMVTFHIANSVGPKSIFETSEYLAYCFLLLMEEAEIRFGCHTLTTSTWLNEKKAFTAYFPQEWRDNMTPRTEEKPVPRWHFGWWGQLVTGRGTINPKAEEFVRKNGFLKCAERASHCSFENMRRHLKENFLKS